MLRILSPMVLWIVDICAVEGTTLFATALSVAVTLRFVN